MPARKPKHSAPLNKVSIERDGQTYQGWYVVEQKVITVSTSWGEKSTQVGGLRPESLAKIMLRELVDERPR